MNTDNPQPKRKFKIIRKKQEPTVDPAITFVLDEPVTEDVSTKDLSANMPALTRYLYIHTDVEHTLRECFVNPQFSTVDEALFWAYELYFSGFVVEIVEILSSIYAQYFVKPSEKFRQVIAELIADEDRTECIATIVHNLFIKRKRHGPVVWVKYKKSNIAKFCHKFISNDKTENDLSPATFLRTVRRYRVAANPIQLYNKTIDDANWVYFAYYAPLWRKRIHLFRKSMILDHDTETIRFKTDGFANAFGILIM